jgi:hypothetical protein
MIMQVLQSDGEVRSFSSLRFLNEDLTAQSDNPLQPSITSKQVENNLDGNAEQVSLSLYFKTDDPSNIRSISILLGFDYEIRVR